MRVLLDVVHPAHVHFFRHLWSDLTEAGHEVLVVSRDKDVTLDLLDRFQIPHAPAPRAIPGGRLRQAGELAVRVRCLLGHIRRFRPDVVATRNPSGVQAARLTGVPGVFDTDDGSAAGVHFHAARPFARVITTPACLREDFGPKHRRYPGFKALAYLHPQRFRPDPGVRDELGLVADEPLFVARFSAHTASHDARVQGLPAGARQALVARLAARGRVIVSSEGQLAVPLQRHRSPLPADRFHDLLAAADLCVGDSQSVAGEAALLGTPSFRLSSFSGRLDYLRVLEERYGLVRNFLPGEEAAFLEGVERAADQLAALAGHAARSRGELLADSVDVTSWLHALLSELAAEQPPRRVRSAGAAPPPGPAAG